MRKEKYLCLTQFVCDLIFFANVCSHLRFLMAVRSTDGTVVMGAAVH